MLSLVTEMVRKFAHKKSVVRTNLGSAEGLFEVRIELLNFYDMFREKTGKMRQNSAVQTYLLYRKK